MGKEEKEIKKKISCHVPFLPTQVRALPKNSEKIQNFETCHSRFMSGKTGPG